MTCVQSHASVTPLGDAVSIACRERGEHPMTAYGFMVSGSVCYKAHGEAASTKLNTRIHVPPILRWYINSLYGLPRLSRDGQDSDRGGRCSRGLNEARAFEK